MRPLWLILILIPIVLIVDMLWLGVLMTGFYDREIGELMRRNEAGLNPRWGAAAFVYILIPIGLVCFVRPLLGPDSTLAQTFLWGALLGLVTYGIYDMTNLAVLEKWTLTVSLADIAWGGVLNGMMAVVMRLIDQWLGKA